MPQHRLAPRVAVLLAATLVTLTALGLWIRSRTPVERLENDGEQPSIDSPAETAGNPSEAANASRPESPQGVPQEHADAERFTISGVVRQNSGAELTGARAWPLPAGQDNAPANAARNRAAAVAEDGSFQLRDLAAGSYRVVVEADGFLPAVSSPVSVDTEQQQVTVELELSNASVAQGTVIDTDGKPLEGAVVEVAWSSDQSGERFALPVSEEALLALELSRRDGRGESNARGGFEIRDLHPGYYDLKIAADGYGRKRIQRLQTDQEALRVVLAPELFVLGKVTRVHGEPVANATVTLTFLGPDTESLASAEKEDEVFSVHRSRTDKTGSFRLDGLASGAYRADVTHEESVPALAPLVAVYDNNEDETRLHFTLEEGRRIEGVVLDSEGDPLEGAQVSVRFRSPLAGGKTDDEGNRPAGIGNASTRTSDQGRFEFTTLPPGQYSVRVVAPDHVPVDLVRATDQEAVTLALQVERPLDGRVFDRRSGAPVADALVRLSPFSEASEPSDIFVERTDSEGRFRLRGVPSTGGRLTLEAAGYATLSTEIGDTPPDSLSFALERSASVSGRVQVGGDEATAEGLRISLIDASTQEITETGSTGEDGAYRIFVPRPGECRVMVEGAPYAPLVSGLLHVPDMSTELENVDLFPTLAATVRGAVFGEGRGRLAGARVFLVPEKEGVDTPADPLLDFAPPRKALADATGDFAIDGVPAGSYRAVASAAGFIAARSQPLAIAPGGSPWLELELEPEMTIVGRVVDVHGAPLPGVRVAAFVESSEDDDPCTYCREERTDSDVLGRFRLSRLAPRAYDLIFRADGFTPFALTGVTAGRDDLQIELDRPVTASGQVVGLFTAEPVTHFELRWTYDDQHAIPQAERSSLGKWREFREADGSFTIESLPPGRYRVEARAPLFFDPEPIELDIVSGRGLQDIVIELTETGVVAGTVVDGNGLYTADIRVEALQQWIHPETGEAFYRPLRSRSRRRGDKDAEAHIRRGNDSSRRVRTKTGDEGEFVLACLPDGVFRLHLSHDDYVPLELGDYTLEQGIAYPQALDVRAFLSSGITLGGKVWGLDEVVDGSLTVTVWPKDARGDRARRSAKWTYVDSHGRFEIRGLETGEYQLDARYQRLDDEKRVTVRRSVLLNHIQREKTIQLRLDR